MSRVAAQSIVAVGGARGEAKKHFSSEKSLIKDKKDVMFVLLSNVTWYSKM